MYAAREGCVECARALVEGGADPDLSGYRNITPLIMAIDNLHFDTAEYLIEAGATLDMWDWWGRTPLYMAVDMNTLPRGGRPDRASTDKTTRARSSSQTILDARRESERAAQDRCRRTANAARIAAATRCS